MVPPQSESGWNTAPVVLGDEVVCSVERAIHVLSARWTPLIRRELYYRRTRFEDMRQHLGLRSLSSFGREVRRRRALEDLPRQHPSNHDRPVTSPNRTVSRFVQQTPSCRDGNMFRPQKPTGTTSSRLPSPTE